MRAPSDTWGSSTTVRVQCESCSEGGSEGSWTEGCNQCERPGLQQV